MQHLPSDHRRSVFPTFMQSLHYGAMASVLFVAIALVDALPGHVPLLLTPMLRVDRVLLHVAGYAFLSALVYFSMADSPVRRALKAFGTVCALLVVDKLLQLILFHGVAGARDWPDCVAAASICLLSLYTIQTLRVARARRLTGPAPFAR